jgi:hypothetical protein
MAAGCAARVNSIYIDLTGQRPGTVAVQVRTLSEACRHFSDGLSGGGCCLLLEETDWEWFARRAVHAAVTSQGRKSSPDGFHGFSRAAGPSEQLRKSSLTPSQPSLALRASFGWAGFAGQVRSESPSCDVCPAEAASVASVWRRRTPRSFCNLLGAFDCGNRNPQRPDPHGPRQLVGFQVAPFLPTRPCGTEALCLHSPKRHSSRALLRRSDQRRRRAAPLAQHRPLRGHAPSSPLVAARLARLR